MFTKSNPMLVLHSWPHSTQLRREEIGRKAEALKQCPLCNNTICYVIEPKRGGSLTNPTSWRNCLMLSCIKIRPCTPDPELRHRRLPSCTRHFFHDTLCGEPMEQAHGSPIPKQKGPRSPFRKPLLNEVWHAHNLHTKERRIGPLQRSRYQSDLEY